jgi:type 1 glutamine amidotransferase
MAVRVVVVMLLALALGGCGPPSKEVPRVLLYTRTTEYRHESIPAGISAIRALGSEGGFDVDATEDPGAFRTGNLARYRAVIFLSTSGVVLDDEGRRALEAYVRGGGGYVGIHAASTSESDWPFYGELVGARFASHPPISPGTITIEDRKHPATSHLDTTWSRTDEWYRFRTDPRGRVHVLLSMPDGQPLAWCHPLGAGRSFYTALGHTVESYQEQAFRQHLLGGIRWAAGLVSADCAPGGEPGKDESPAADATGLSLPGPGEAPDFHLYSGNE